MLFILHNNVVLSLFLCIFYYTFYTVFCTGYAYFLHILYTFYTYFSHFSRHFLPFLRKNNALPCVFNAFSCVFSINFLQFSVHLYKYCVYFSTHLHSFALCQLLHFLYFCTNFFYTLHETVLVKRTALHKLFPACRRTFSSL